MKKILISTGGSGGHVIPAITMYDHFNENFEVTLITDSRGAKYIPKKKYNFKIIDTPKITKNIIYIPIIILKFIIAMFKSYLILKNNKIEYLISTGGYMSSPICIVSLFLKINIFLFEPNYILGRSNKFFLKFSRRIICYSNKIKNFPENYIKKIFVIESILRKDIYNFKNNQKKINNNDNFNILVIGGSQGADFFDKKLKKVFNEISSKKKIYLIQQISNKNIISELSEEYKKNNLNYELFFYDDEIYKKFKNIDFVITRSGASIISELIYFNIPFLAIPFPYAKDDHQFVNANYFFQKKLCWLIRQEDFEVNNLVKLIENLSIDKKEYFLLKESMKNFSYQNTWNNVNQKLIGLINEN